MFSIRLSDTFLDLHPDTSLNLQLNNPIFDNESFARVFSYPFTLPDTPQNLKTLEFPDRYDTKGRRIFSTVFLYIDNILFQKGELVLNSHIKNRISVVFRNHTLAAIEALEKTNLRSILDTINIPRLVTPHYDLQFTLAQEWYTLSVNTLPITYFAEPGTPLQNIIDQFLEAINDPFYIRSVGTQIAADSIRIAANPDSDLRIDNLTNIEITGEQSTPDANIINLKAYVDAVVNQPIEEITFPCILNREKYGTENKEWIGFFNFWRDGEQITNVGHDEKFFFHSWSPCIRIPYLFKKIAEAVSLVKIGGDFLAHVERQELILFTNLALDNITEEKDLNINTVYYINGHKHNLNLNDFIPDKTAKQILLDFMGFFNLFAEVKNNELTLISKVSRINQPTIDWTDKAQTLIEKRFETKEGFTLSFSNAKKDTVQVVDTSSLKTYALSITSSDNPDTFVVTNQLLPIVIGEGKKKITPAISTLYDYIQTYHLPTILSTPDTHTWKIPTLGTKEETLRLLFYRGLHFDNQGKQYPLAQHGNTDLLGASTGTLTLDWTGATGLYETQWKDYLQLAEADTYTLYAQLNILDFLQLQDWQYTKIAVQTPKGRIVGIIKSVQTQVSMKGLGLSKVLLARQ